MLPSVKGLLRRRAKKKRNNISPLPGRSFFHLPSLDPHSVTGAMNQKKETQSIAAGSKENS